MRMITGFLAPTAGRVTLADVDVARKPLLAKRSLGYLPETLALYPEMRVREYVAFRAQLCGVPRRDAKARVDEALGKCFVDDVASTPIGNLSKGYRPVSYTHLRAHETRHDLVCRLLLEKKKNK